MIIFGKMKVFEDINREFSVTCWEKNLRELKREMGMRK